MTATKEDAKEQKELDGFRHKVLEEHNRLRRRHGAPDLVLDSKLNTEAQTAAEGMAKLGKLQCNGTYGNNVFATSGDPIETIRKYYETLSTYDFQKSEFVSSASNITQILWKSTTSIGIGLKKNEEGHKYVSILYDPRGNVADAFSRNIFPAGTAVTHVVSPNNVNEMRKLILSDHNLKRALHGTPPLALDTKLCKVAQDYANKLAAANQMVHSTNGYGENLAMCYEVNMSTHMWYDEIKDYDFDKGVFAPATGHFTQVVWKDSKLLGVGWAKSSLDNKYYVCANYHPPGNYKGQYAVNVPRLI